ncbi:MAG: hypothetical protein ACHQ1D_11445 [Nitrososphaerales archaeon]
MTGRHKKQIPPPESEISPYTDREIRILVNRCDICNNQLPQTPENDNLVYRMDVLAEINDSFESVHDKSEPKLLLCAKCSAEFMISS